MNKTVIGSWMDERLNNLYIVEEKDLLFKNTDAFSIE